MVKTFTLIFLVFLFAGCSKTVEKMQENAIIKAMTDGQWVITSFVKAGTDITTEFSGYKFQYYSNETVDAIKNGTVEKKGKWKGDVNNMSIFAQFDNTSNPISLINGTWHIDNNSWTFVVASLVGGSETRTLRLEKQ